VRPGAAASAEARPVALRGAAAGVAVLLCALPVLLGFVLPVAVLLRLVWMTWVDAQVGDAGVPLARFVQWSWTSFRLAALAAVLATAIALALASAQRLGAGRWLAAGARIVGLGYAVPGAVLVVGILLPVGYVQARWPELGLGAVVTGTAFGIVYAYLVRFSAVALQSVEAGYARLPAGIDETARTLGASRWRVFAELHLPLLKRASLAAALLVFVDVMKELPATLVLRPFDSDTLAVIAYNLARDERLGEAALPSLAIVLVGLVPVVLLSRAMRRE
jgi:iron(III) transport system permease protein